MGTTKKREDSKQPDDANNNSDSSKIEEVRKALSKPIPVDLYKDSFSPAELNFYDFSRNGLTQIEWEKIQEISNVNKLTAIESYLDNIKIFPSSADDYLNILSNKFESFENIITSANAIINLQNSEPGTVSKDDLDKEYKKIEKATETFDEANKGAALASRTSPNGYQYLKNNPELRKNFDGSFINATVVSIDIRSSTQLMLNAKSPTDFFSFISDVSVSLSALVKSFGGVYDKFTGDGLLCFFPSFYSGKDHVYLALMFAESCHKLFQRIYDSHLDKFSVVKAGEGLGIGIDVGDTYLTFVNNEPTVIGTSVVYACRLSGAPCGTTYINQQVFEVIKKKYPDNFVVTPCEMEFKGQGKMRVYECVSSEKLDPIPLPGWATDEVKETNESTEKV